MPRTTARYAALKRHVQALVATAALALSQSCWCTEELERFTWTFADAAPQTWEVIEGGNLLGDATTIRAMCADETELDATCSILNLVVSGSPADDFTWFAQIFATSPSGFEGQPLDPTFHVLFTPDCELCCEQNEDTGGFIPSQRATEILSAIWSNDGSTASTARITFDLTVRVPAVDQSTLSDFPECPAQTFEFRIAGTVVGRRTKVIREHCGA